MLTNQQGFRKIRQFFAIKSFRQVLAGSSCPAAPDQSSHKISLNDGLHVQSKTRGDYCLAGALTSQVLLRVSVVLGGGHGAVVHGARAVWATSRLAYNIWHTHSHRQQTVSPHSIMSTETKAHAMHILHCIVEAKRSAQSYQAESRPDLLGLRHHTHL